MASNGLVQRIILETCMRACVTNCACDNINKENDTKQTLDTCCWPPLSLLNRDVDDEDMCVRSFTCYTC